MSQIAVVIITYKRPEVVRQNLACLAAQSLSPDRVLVIDASDDDRTLRVVDEFSRVMYVKNAAGAGNMTSSRNVALGLISEDIVVFLDDDALPRIDYIERVRDFYQAHPLIALTCSRTCNGVAGEDQIGLTEIGKLTEDGVLIGNFAAAADGDRPIDHGIGATMAFRLTLLQELGGFREYYNGVSGVREDADAFLRARAIGYQAWFIHDAVADHVAAAQHRGQRFDRRYRHWAARNQAILIVANYGLRSSMLRRNFTVTLRESRAADSSNARAVARAMILGTGYVRGLIEAVSILGLGPRDPIGAYRRNVGRRRAHEIRSLVPEDQGA